MTFSRSINLDQAVIHEPEVSKVVRPRMDDQSIRRAHSLDLGGRRRACRQGGVGRALHCKRNMTPPPSTTKWGADRRRRTSWSPFRTAA